MVKEACLINGITGLALTKLDVLSGLKDIELAVAYKYKGKIFKQFPYDFEVLTKSRPVYKKVKGWKENITNINSFKDLPSSVKNYVSVLEDLCGAQVSIVSIGSGREETLFL